MTWYVYILPYHMCVCVCVCVCVCKCKCTVYVHVYCVYDILIAVTAVHNIKTVHHSIVLTAIIEYFPPPSPPHFLPISFPFPSPFLPSSHHRVVSSSTPVTRSTATTTATSVTMTPGERTERRSGANSTTPR